MPPSIVTWVWLNLPRANMQLLFVSKQSYFSFHDAGVMTFMYAKDNSSRDPGSLHQTAILATGVQLRHRNPRPPAVESDEDFHNPLVPHLAIVGLAPHADFDFGVVRHVDRGLRFR